VRERIAREILRTGGPALDRLIHRLSVEHDAETASWSTPGGRRAWFALLGVEAEGDTLRAAARAWAQAALREDDAGPAPAPVLQNVPLALPA
jgi:hypothetical protein